MTPYAFFFSNKFTVGRTLSLYKTCSLNFFLNRNASPKLEKRKSCPDASVDTRGKMVRSMTLSAVPTFTLPPERVQPPNGHERSQSLTPLQYQQKIIGHLQPDLYRLALCIIYLICTSLKPGNKNYSKNIAFFSIITRLMAMLLALLEKMIMLIALLEKW